MGEFVLDKRANRNRTGGDDFVTSSLSQLENPAMAGYRETTPLFDYTPPV